MAAAKKKKPTAKPAAKKPAAKKPAAKRPAAGKSAAKKPAAKKPAAAPAPAPKPVVFAPKKSTPVRPPVTPPASNRVSPVRTAVRNPASRVSPVRTASENRKDLRQVQSRPAAVRTGDTRLAGNRTDVRTGDTQPAAAAPVDQGARVEALWARLEAWVAAAGAPALELNPPASEKEIKAAEKAIGVSFPVDYRASLRLHDGQASHGAGGRSFPWLPGCQPLAPLERVVAEHARRQKQVKPTKQLALPLSGADRVKPGLHLAGRIPVAGGPKWDGDTTFLDLEPAPAGTAGQLVTMINKNDVVFVDSSFAAALERWVNVLERGLWSYDRDRHAVHPRALVPQSAHPAGWFSRR